MKFFIDTADIDEIREAQSWGLLDGVTTNPSLVARTGKPFRSVLEEICEVVDGPISAEVTAMDFNGMISQAKELAAIHPNIVVKVPLVMEGLKAVRARIRRNGGRESRARPPPRPQRAAIRCRAARFRSALLPFRPRTSTACPSPTRC